jgi:hypothetical protein
VHVLQNVDSKLEIYCQPSQVRLLIEQILRSILEESQVVTLNAQGWFIRLAARQDLNTIAIEFRFPIAFSSCVNVLVGNKLNEPARNETSTEKRFSAYLLNAVLQIHRGQMLANEEKDELVLLLQLPRLHQNLELERKILAS